jgi:hypothetical protein
VTRNLEMTMWQHVRHKPHMNTNHEEERDCHTKIATMATN